MATDLTRTTAALIGLTGTLKRKRFLVRDGTRIGPGTDVDIPGQIYVIRTKREYSWQLDEEDGGGERYLGDGDIIEISGCSLMFRCLPDPEEYCLRSLGVTYSP